MTEQELKARRRAYSRKHYYKNHEQSKARARGYAAKNIEKHRQYARDYYRNNPEKVKAYRQSFHYRQLAKKWRRPKTKLERRRHMLRQYGLTISQYDQMVKSQNGKCLICGNSEFRKSRWGGTTNLAVDHCHETKKVRGLLCHKCNAGLGLFEHDVSALKRAVEYLSAAG